MKIGISGASGNLGKAVLAEIRARTADVKLVGISRTPDRLASGVESRLGDYDRPETLTEDVVNAVASIQAEFSAGAFDVVTGDVERLSGRAPKTLQEVLSALSSTEAKP